MLNSKTPVYTSVGEARVLFEKKFNGILSSFGKGIDCDMVINRCLSSISMNTRSNMIFKDDVVKCMRAYKGLIFSEVDKNINTWSVMCSCLYKRRMIESFGGANKSYINVNMNDKEVKNIVVSNYKEMGLDVICKGNKNWKVPTGRIIVKDKDFSCTRPIVSYQNWYAKMLGKRVARALNIMIKAVAKEHDTMELVNADDAIRVIKSLNRLPNWKKQLEDNKFTSVELDIKEQFTNLDKKECFEALEWMFSKIRSIFDNKKVSVLVMKRVSDKVSDRILMNDKITTSNRKYAHVLSLGTIKKYVRFELDNAFMNVGDYYGRQIHGLPIGGLVSAPVGYE